MTKELIEKLEAIAGTLEPIKDQSWHGKWRVQQAIKLANDGLALLREHIVDANKMVADPEVDGVREDLRQLIRVALTNPAGLQEFIAANYPKEWATHAGWVWRSWQAEPTTPEPPKVVTRFLTGQLTPGSGRQREADFDSGTLRADLIDAIGVYQGWEESAVKMVDECILPVLGRNERREKPYYTLPPESRICEGHGIVAANIRTTEMTAMASSPLQCELASPVAAIAGGASARKDEGFGKIEPASPPAPHQKGYEPC